MDGFGGFGASGSFGHDCYHLKPTLFCDIQNLRMRLFCLQLRSFTYKLGCFIKSRSSKPNQRKGQNEKFMNFAHFCEFWCFSLGKQARSTLSFCSGMPLRKVHELTFLCFGLPGPLLILLTVCLFYIFTLGGETASKKDSTQSPDGGGTVSKNNRISTVCKRKTKPVFSGSNKDQP